MISADDYRPCTTQIFPKNDPYLTTDSVFAVKDDLVVDFVPLEGDTTASHELHLDLALAPKGSRQAVVSPAVKDGQVKFWAT